MSRTIRNRIKKLRYVPAGELAHNPDAWRNHPDRQRTVLSDLLDGIGWADACLAYEKAGELTLIDGHLRKDLAIDQPVPTIVLDVNEAEAASLLASLDPLAGMATADEEALLRVLDAARLTDELLDELQRRYLHGLRRTGGSDEIPAVSSSPRVRSGELWGLGEHRLLCGDARSTEDLARLMSDDRADVLWTDPPYGVSYVGKTNEELTIANDGPDGLPALLQAAFAAADGVLRAGAAIYVCHPAGAHAMAYLAAFVQTGWRLHQTLIWVKDRAVLGHADYHYRHEPILFGYRAGRGRRGRGHGGWYGGNDEDSVFEIPRPAASREHPTAKPVELVRRCLDNSSRRTGIVLDPFAGSGTTLIAAEDLGRRARVMEIDPRYADVIVRRWEGQTGKEAILLDG